jgi:tRNA(Ile)-lysidine synthase
MSEADLLERARATNLLTPGVPVLVLLSGGRDSVCLLDVVVRIAGRDATGALHVNYGLRAEAATDERSCRALCERLGVPLAVERAAAPPAGNVQAWARELRYAAAARHAARRGALIAAGHTKSDQAETILYRLAAAPGRRALLGMRPRDGRLVRPLLDVTRAETAAYCTGRGLPWVEDATNSSPVYARNRVRAGLVPALEAIHPAAVENVVRTATLLRAESEVLDALVDEALAGGDAITADRLGQLPPPLCRLVVQRLADAAAGAPVPGAAARAEEVAALAEGAALDLGAGVRARRRAGEIRMRPSEGRAARTHA